MKPGLSRSPRWRSTSAHGGFDSHATPEDLDVLGSRDLFAGDSARNSAIRSRIRRWRTWAEIGGLLLLPAGCLEPLEPYGEVIVTVHTDTPVPQLVSAMRIDVYDAAVVGCEIVAAAIGYVRRQLGEGQVVV